MIVVVALRVLAMRRGMHLPVLRKSSSYVDARRCLDLETNPEVIVCADEYLPHPRGAAGS